MIPKPIKWTYQSDRSQEIARQLKESNYDVIFFQEAFMASFRKKINNTLGTQYPFSNYVGVNSFIPLVGTGVFILSKYPYKVLENIHYRHCRGGDCFAAKGASLIELSLPEGKRLQFAVTHMQAGIGSAVENIRTHQLKQIKKAMAKYKTLGVPQFLAGDLNVDALVPGEFERTKKLMQMKHSPLTGDLTHTGGIDPPCYRKSGPFFKKWIDHLLVSEDSVEIETKLKVRSLKGNIQGRSCDLSDHYALEAIIQISPALSPLKLAIKDKKKL